MSGRSLLMVPPTINMCVPLLSAFIIHYSMSEQLVTTVEMAAHIGYN
jgi:hypothetical protein